MWWRITRPGYLENDPEEGLSTEMVLTWKPGRREDMSNMNKIPQHKVTPCSTNFVQNNCPIRLWWSWDSPVVWLFAVRLEQDALLTGLQGCWCEITWAGGSVTKCLPLCLGHNTWGSYVRMQLALVCTILGHLLKSGILLLINSSSLALRRWPSWSSACHTTMGTWVWCPEPMQSI